MSNGLQLSQDVLKRVKVIAAYIEELIRKEACALWEYEGRPGGQALRHWLQAENEIWHELIRERAAALWEQEGRPEGRDLSHWLRAEVEIWHDVTQERAYALWEQEGRPAGRELANWLQAEAAIEAARFANWPERIGTPCAASRARAGSWLH